MKIELREITIGELSGGYVDNEEIKEKRKESGSKEFAVAAKENAVSCVLMEN